jgi:hypothetical protein
MGFKNFWVKLLKSIPSDYSLLKNILKTGRYNLIVEFSKSSIDIMKILLKKNKNWEIQEKLFLIGHFIILKSGGGLIFFRNYVFKIEKLKQAQNLNAILKKYSTKVNIRILNNYFRILFLYLR